MLSLKNLACRRDTEQLFSDVNQIIYRAQKTGITGANGSGKSSLFSLILGELEPDEGEVELQNGVVIAHVAQETGASERCALDFVIDGDVALRGVEAKIDHIADHDGAAHANLLAEFEAMGGYSAAARAGSLLFGLGFSATQQQQPVSQFSGGWRMRLNLAQALMCPSDMLLLDEPTNHLDLDAVIWLEQWLLQYSGALLLISHDREFLDRTIKQILHIEQSSMKLYTGDYSAFEKARAEQLAGQQSAYVRQQKKIGEIQGFVDRFRAKATKARQAQSRLKMLEKMTLIAPAHIDSAFRFSFRAPVKLPHPLLTLEKVSAGYAQNTVLQSVDMTVQVGDRIGLLGMNGAGKSTLLKTLVGDLAPLAGEREASTHLAIGYFAQHQIDQLQFTQTPLQHLLNCDKALAESAARDFLGGFGFQGEQVSQKVSTLSGGEKARLALSLIVYARPNLLLLDEPTNHLDLDMRQALCEALQSFQGALLVISHDRFLLRSVADEFLLVADGGLRPFDDDLDGYARWLADNREQSGSATTKQESKGLSAADRQERKREAAQRRAQIAPLRKVAEKIEKQLEHVRDDLEFLREKLADNQLYSDNKKQELAELMQQEAKLQAKITELEESWLQALENLENAERNG